MEVPEGHDTMRTDKTACVPGGDWRWQLQNRVEGLEGLLEALQARGQSFDETALARVVGRYRFRAVPYYLDLIDWDDPSDPIRRQCIPDPRELEDDPDGGVDPYGELTRTGIPGVLHRFSDRVLIMTTSACPMYCRHCTRKNTLENPGMQSDAPGFCSALDYVAAHPEVREVLLSGGEPLLLENAVLDRLLGALLAIPHVEVIRIGSRAPAVLPMRIDDGLTDVLRRHRPVWFNTQFNHPRELTPEAAAACGLLADAGIPLSNQTVLLKGVNDDAATMRELCAGLQRMRVRPYYVFQCDPVSGIRHFRTPRGTAVALSENLRRHLGGLCLPRFVEDRPGRDGKTEIRGDAPCL